MNHTSAAFSGTPPAEFIIDETLVTALLQEQQPDLAHLPLQPVGQGWDNAVFRLGERWAVRLPRRAAAVPLLVHEQTWLPRLAPQLTLPVPVPDRTGKPGRGYPWPWSIVPWLEGETADQQPPHTTQAGCYAAFLRSLHVAAPADAPLNSARGVPLSQRATLIQQRMNRVARQTHLITPTIKHLWEAGLQAPLAEISTWLHGDLHPGNVLVEKGVLCGILDWGDLTAGDRATDLASIWMLFPDRQARQQALNAYGLIDPALRQRAQGWAVLFGVTLLDVGLVDQPAYAVLGRRILERLEEDLQG